MFSITENKSFLGKKAKSSKTLKKANQKKENLNSISSISKNAIFSISKVKKVRKKTKKSVASFVSAFASNDSPSKNYCKNNFFLTNKESSRINEINLNNFTIKSFSGDIYNLDEQPKNLGNLMDENMMDENNLVSPFSGASLTKKYFKSTWDKEEEVSVFAVYLLYKLLDEKIKFSYISRLITTKNSSQIYQHLYRQKNSFELFSKVFFCFFECKKINNQDYMEFTLEQLFGIFKINIMNSEFIKFFFENVTDKKCLKFVRNIYEYLTFEPKLYISGKKLKFSNQINENLQDVEAVEAGDENSLIAQELEIFSPINKISPEKKKFGLCDSNAKFESPLLKICDYDNLNSIEGELNKYISNSFFNCQNANTIRSENNINSINSINNTGNLNPNINKDYSNKEICNFKIKNMSLKIEGETYEKLKSFSSSSKSLVIDDNFFVNYLISKFKANSSN